MNVKQDAETSRLDTLKWASVGVLFIAGLWANYHYNQLDWALRVAGWIVVFSVMILISLQTSTGKRVWAFAKDARGELRKVVWPTRQETIQTTLIIVAMVVCMSLILWGIDTVLLWVIGWLTGERG